MGRATGKVFYFDDQHPLILGAICPLIRDLRKRGIGAYFTRGWLAGPHVEIAIEFDPQTEPEWFASLVEKHVGAFLASNPSTGELDFDRLHNSHKLLAQLEGKKGPLPDLARDNTIVLGPWEAEPSTAPDESLRQFHIKSTDLAFHMLERMNRLPLEDSLDLAIATACRFGGGLPSGALSLASHAEGFLSSAAKERRESLERSFKQRQEGLSLRILKVARLVGEGSLDQCPSWMTAWLRVLDEFHEDVDDTKVRALLQIPPSGSGYWSDLKSPLHQRMAKSSKYVNAMNESSHFLRYRLSLNLLYLHFHRLGLAPKDRLIVCYFASRGVEVAYDVSLPQRLDETIEQLERGALDA